ncbi:MAG: hypothetical protein N3B16_12290 [Candidatus Aminicenantes bacterium]|nr:hypothetical protein [Candidatus Aminicenantes bacterium]
MKQIIGLLFILIISYHLSAQAVILNKINYYPKRDSDYYFRPICDLDISGNYLYGVVNFEDKILKFKLNNGLKLEKIIGKQGQGPGDLIRPVALSICQGELVVRDNVGYSIYDLEGNFKQRFRAFTSNISFLFIDDIIFTINPHPEEYYLIEAYAKDGKRLYDFGDKFIRLRDEIFKGLNPFEIEKNVYQGNLLSDGKHIYYANSKFGKIIKFDKKGRKVEEKDITAFFGEKGKKILKKNQEMWLDKGIDITLTHSFKPYDLFMDAFLSRGNIYLLGSEWVPGEKDREPIVEIICLDANSLTLSSKYMIKRAKDERFFCFAIDEQGNEPTFYVSMEDENGYVISIYKK